MSDVSTAATSARPTAHPLWDWPTRVFHWLLVAALPLAWWTAEEGHMEWHEWTGYLLLVLVVFRLAWGWVGSRASRFATFVRGPGGVLAYLKGREPGPEGHNPLGGWAILSMLLLLVLQVVSGLFNGDDLLFDGPLRHLVSSAWQDRFGVLHDICFNLLLALIGLHLLAIGYYQLGRGEKLVQAMLLGRAPGREGVVPPAPWWRALLLVALAGAGLWGLLALVPAPVSYW